MKPAHEVHSHHSHSLPTTAAPTSLCATPEPCLCDWWQGHMRTWVTNRNGLWITPPKIQGIIFNLERFKDMVYGVMPWAVLVTQLVWWQAETMGWKQEGRGRKSSSQLWCHQMHSGMRPHGRVCKIWSSLQFPLAFLSGCYNHWSLGYLRHDAREMKHFSCYVWQVTVQEDKEWLNHSDFMGETGGKGCYKSQKDSNQYSTDPHYKEVSNSSEYINNLNCAHLAERLEQIVQDLWEKEKSTSCFWILFNFLLCYHVPLIQCWTLYFSIYLEHTFEICCCLLLTFVSSTNIREIYKEG